MQVPHSEDIASYTVPESCVSYREVRREALTGVRAGQQLSRESFKIQGADAVSIAEGNTVLGAIASPSMALRGLVPAVRRPSAWGGERRKTRSRATCHSV